MSEAYTHHLFTRKLHIGRLERFDESHIAIRFVGHRDEFMSLIEALRAEDYDDAHWNAAVFDGKGGWVIERFTLEMYKDRFDNLEQRLKRLERQTA